jgi:LmbE family N-acetylglucosaminyl deacetylase
MPPDSGGLLLVHAHPDDESAATGGTMARYAAEGRRLDLVTCTGGEEGEIHDPELDPEEAKPRLRQIRMSELACSIETLGRGAITLHLLGYRDSGMIGTPSNEHPDAFWQVDLETATARLVEIVRAARPAVMVSYDSNGNYGHPDHINAHRIAVAAWEAAADGSRHPDSGPPHATAKLYEIAFNREGWFELMMEMRRRNLPLPWDFDAEMDRVGESSSPDRAAEDLNPTNVEAMRQIEERLEAGGEPPEEFGTPDAEITTRIDVAGHAAAKRRSMDCHRTQRQDMGWLLDLPSDLFERAMETEFYVLRRWRGREVPPDYRETDLFAGL